MRTTLDYLPKYLNNAAAASPGGVQDNTTGLRISTGTNSGDFIELTDAQAAQVSSNGVSVVLLTAGSGQTNGTYTANASYGPAVLTYVVSGGAVTSVSMANAGYGIYTPAFVTANGGSVPTFTIAAGGTPGTVQAVLTQLFAGIYQRTKLTAGLTQAIIGTSLYWNRADTTDPYAVTNVSGAIGQDFAGVVVDPLMGATPANSSQLCCAWIQVNGKTQVQMAAAAATVGTTISVPTTSTNAFLQLATNPTYVGITQTAAAGALSVCQAILRNAQTRF